MIHEQRVTVTYIEQTPPQMAMPPQRAQNCGQLKVKDGIQRSTFHFRHCCILRCILRGSKRNVKKIAEYDKLPLINSSDFSLTHFWQATLKNGKTYATSCGLRVMSSWCVLKSSRSAAYQMYDKIWTYPAVGADGDWLLDPDVTAGIHADPDVGGANKYL